MILFISGLIIGLLLGWKHEAYINSIIETIKLHLNIKQYCNSKVTHHISLMVYTNEEHNFYSKENNMLNYSDVKNYWSKFANDYAEDVKSFWNNYLDTVQKFYNK